MKGIKNKKRAIFLVVIVAVVAVAVLAFVMEMSEDRREFRRWKQLQEMNQSENTQNIQQTESATGQDDTSQTQAESKDIGMQKAQEIALTDAGLSDADVITQSVRENNVNGVKVYKVEFATSDWKYSYEVAASDGQIRQADRQRPDVNSGNAASGSSQISIDQAKEIAQKHAGVSGSVHYTKAKLEREDGRNIYEIEFYQNGIEYEFEILASDGSVLDYSSERDD